MSSHVVAPAIEFPVARPMSKRIQQGLVAFPLLVRAGILGISGPSTTKTLLGAVKNWGYSMSALAEMGKAKNPDSYAVHDDFGSLTFAELSEAARTTARYLRLKGIGQGDIVAVLSRNSRYPMISLCSVGFLGASPILLNPASSPVQIEKIMKEANADIIIADREFEDVLSSTSARVVIVADAQNDAEAKDRDYLEGIFASDQVLPELPEKVTQSPTIVCSSGTRGVPKAVVLPVSEDAYVLAGILKTISWRQGLVVQQRATFFHAWGWLNLQLALSTTSTLVLRQEFDPAVDVADCRKYGVNALVSAPPFVDALIDESDKENKPIGPFKFIVSSGNKVPASTLKKVTDHFGPVMYSFYGSTEHGQISIADTDDMLEDSTIVGKTPVGIGIKVFRDDGTEASVGEEGEVFSSNHMSMRGFVSPDDSVKLQDGLIDTGDRGYFDDKGRLHVAGRSDDMVIQGGENVHFEEINDIILDLDGINEAFVWGKQDGMYAKITAYLVKDSSDAAKALTDEAVREQVAKNLARHSVPADIVWMDEIPMNDAGKYVPREFISL